MGWRKKTPVSAFREIGRVVWRAILRLKQTHLVTFVAFCLGLFWLNFVYFWGLEFTPDSTQYMTYATKMHYASEFAVAPFWPPLYPILINLFMLLTGFPAEAAALLSGASMILFPSK